MKPAAPVASSACRVARLAAACLLSLGLAGLPTTAAEVAPVGREHRHPAGGDAASVPADYARAGEVLLRIPDGWTLSDHGGGTYVLMPDKMPAGETVKIVISPPSPDRPTLRDQMQAELDAGQKLRAFQQQTPITPVQHPAGYDVLTMVVSFNDKPFTIRPIDTWAMLVHIGGGPEVPSVPVMLYATTRELMAEHIKTFDAFISQTRLPSRMILAERAGQPPLTLRTVNQVNDFLEWLLEVPLTEGQRGAIGRYLADAWTKGDEEGVEAVQSIAKVRDQLSALTADQKNFAREAARTEALKTWREEARQGDAMAKMMIDIHDAAHAPLAPGADGEPPLTRQAADASLEIIYFMASKVADPGARGFQLHPTQEQKDRWAAELAATYGQLPVANKQELAEMAARWAALRMLWPELSGEDRVRLAAGWADAAPVKMLADQVKKGQRAAEARDIANVMRQMDAHRQLVNMGAYRLNYRYVYR